MAALLDGPDVGVRFWEELALCEIRSTASSASSMESRESSEPLSLGSCSVREGSGEVMEDQAKFEEPTAVVGGWAAEGSGWELLEDWEGRDEALLMMACVRSGEARFEEAREVELCEGGGCEDGVDAAFGPSGEGLFCCLCCSGGSPRAVSSKIEGVPGKPY